MLKQCTTAFDTSIGAAYIHVQITARLDPRQTRKAPMPRMTQIETSGRNRTTLGRVTKFGKTYTLAIASIDGRETPVVGIQQDSNVGDPEKQTDWFAIE